MQLLDFKTQAREEILFGKDAFDQLRCWQDFPKRMVNVSSYLSHWFFKRKLEYHPTKQHKLFYKLNTQEHCIKQCLVSDVQL